MRKAGFHVSIDDFGTGYSSLATLRRLPADELERLALNNHRLKTVEFRQSLFASTLPTELDSKLH
jgi:EAL domain-containing protein (putative c-di-GMP-specific phosphodiesterase class I)